jgi:hypothetical protein
MESLRYCLPDQGVAVAGEMCAVALGGIGLEIADHVALHRSTRRAFPS